MAKTFHAFASLLPSSQQPATRSHPEPDECRCNYVLDSHLRQGLRSGKFLAGFQTKLCAFLIAVLCAGLSKNRSKDCSFQLNMIPEVFHQHCDKCIDTHTQYDV
jgi:hypothetical protein